MCLGRETRQDNLASHQFGHSPSQCLGRQAAGREACEGQGRPGPTHWSESTTEGPLDPPVADLSSHYHSTHSHLHRQRQASLQVTTGADSKLEDMRCRQEVAAWSIDSGTISTSAMTRQPAQYSKLRRRCCATVRHLLLLSTADRTDPPWSCVSRTCALRTRSLAKLGGHQLPALRACARPWPRLGPRSRARFGCGQQYLDYAKQSKLGTKVCTWEQSRWVEKVAGGGACVPNAPRRRRVWLAWVVCGMGD